MPRPNPLTPAVQAAFLAALRGGALVVAAAASVGVPIQTLYRRRRRDPAFDSAWAAAAEASSGWVLKRRRSGRGRRRWTRVPTKRRLRFAAKRRAALLAALERGRAPGVAAREAGVHPRTVGRSLLRDPGFALDHEAALERGLWRREKETALARARSAARMKRIVERSFAAWDGPDRELRRQLRRLRPHWRLERRRGGRGGWRWRPLGPGKAIPAVKRMLTDIVRSRMERSLGRGRPP